MKWQVTNYGLQQINLDLLISMDAYMEALCFSDIGRKEVKKLLPITDKEIDEIIKVSLWNKIL